MSVGVLRLVVAARIQGELAEKFSVLADNTDVEIGHEDDDAFAFVRATDPDVMQPAVVADRDHTACVDAITSDAEVTSERDADA